MQHKTLIRLAALPALAGLARGAAYAVRRRPG
jgi:hypothetical protein